ncbi:unnamed protein product [Ceutorhynchus assimilis]|uniref:Uncharacterized protein n=1 Tax=Ceutorhynchus assimilis TaxID=467358 RepID=A0A9N9MLM2_9CUCU|nr:unnamed protein product [Ceutorhynchus assimilis]
MKYHTLGSSNIAAETKPSGFTLYADLGLSDHDKMTFTKTDMKKLREQLEIVQKDLKHQTKRCRYLVAEYTRKLQEKEKLYQNEKSLRDTQLAKVLKALLIFEARLRQEQKLISHQLNEKDYIINTQTNDIKKLLANQYCKNCNQYYPSPPVVLESFDSSSEYVPTEHDYQSSNLESLDSSSETYAASEPRSESDSYEKKNIFQKNKHQGRRKVGHRKSTGTYFEVLKLRNDSPLSNDDNTSADYDNLDSLPPESISDKISTVSENIENMLNNTRSIASTPSESSSVNISSSECDKTVIINTVIAAEENPIETNKLTETIPVFESGGDTNDNWYASASDQEDEDRRDVYRNNPVLECMNQILLQNINDINSPPKTPNIERKNKNNKRVKFSDEEETNPKDEVHDYYETPIQKTPNFYETPQSIYSNDYEQILSKCSETSSESPTSKPEVSPRESKNSHHYIEMENQDQDKTRKNKISRTPPALPPKPPNLVAKCKIQTLPKKAPSENGSSIDLEPDYCSISELNLPHMNKISVVAEVHPEKPSKKINTEPLKDEVPNLVVKKCVEKLNIQLAKQTSVKPERIQSPKKKQSDIQIPKLPQVSEILIPDDPDENDDEEEIISQDNYIKNSTQITQQNSRKQPIQIGTSVSSLISGFNNHQIINEIKKKHERIKPETKRMFSSFENLQNLDKHFTMPKLETTSFENFDLSQNFEEFKLDDCEIEEYDVEEELEREEKANEEQEDTRVEYEYIRATSLNQASVDLLKKQLELQRNQTKDPNNEQTKIANQPTYEHFLECTGLSSKSILTPARTLTNHKHMLKPKDVKLRSKVRASANIFERHSTGGKIKYWSEPFV